MHHLKYHENISRCKCHSKKFIASVRYRFGTEPARNIHHRLYLRIDSIISDTFPFELYQLVDGSNVPFGLDRFPLLFLCVGLRREVIVEVRFESSAQCGCFASLSCCRFPNRFANGSLWMILGGSEAEWIQSGMYRYLYSGIYYFSTKMF